MMRKHQTSDAQLLIGEFRIRFAPANLGRTKVKRHVRRSRAWRLIVLSYRDNKTRRSSRIQSGEADIASPRFARSLVIWNSP